MRKIKNKKLLGSLVVAGVLTALVYLAWPTASGSVAQTTSQQSSKTLTTESSSLNKQQYPVDTASSLWVVVNKGRQLPSIYAPADLVVPTVSLRLSASSSEMRVRADTARAIESMFASAKQEAVNLMLASGYRSYAAQESVYSGYVKTYGQAQADTFSARPGHSEHQTGLAADIEPLNRHCELDICFEATPEGQWLAVNAYQYGFIIRYQKAMQNMTGYQYEPWHIRFVGQALAAQLHTNNQTLEQFFNLPAITDYPAQSFELKI
ncbi:M15 family metallopeptidase [Candidatus Saccharibacteria bacterium]|nr:M15 family metallopeptidase [Candidatus Saccharibacteria bacterium]